jgi:AraC family transcriptional regulator
MESPQDRSSEISELLGASTLTSPSSVRLGWDGVAVERRTIHPDEKPEQSIHQHFLLLWDTHVAVGESERKPGTFVPYRKLPNTITTCPPGVRPATRSATEHTVVVCAMSRQFVDGVETELDQRPSGTLHQLYGTDDVVLRDLILLLAREATAGGPSGRVYAESLSTALATRLLFSARELRPSGGARSSPLPRRTLRRVLERIEAELDTELTLKLLAAESGYSRAHFSRMFTAATGQAPHRYLLERRLKRAESLLERGSLSLSEIAFTCGFSSHAHFSAAFRSRYGLTPSAYRATVRSPSAG